MFVCGAASLFVTSELRGWAGESGAEVVGITRPGEQLLIDLLRVGELGFEVPVIAGHLLGLENASVPERFVGFDGEQEMLLARVHTDESGIPDEVNGRLLDFFVKGA